MKKYFITVLFVGSLSSASALTCTDLPKNLTKGAESSPTLLLQNFLFDKGYLKAKPNGYYGSDTVIAVKAYQKSIGLSQAGSVGPGTRAAIKKESCPSTTTATTLKVLPLKTSTTTVTLSNSGASKNSSKLASELVVITKNYQGVLFDEIPNDYDFKMINGKPAWTMKDGKKKGVVC